VVLHQVVCSKELPESFRAFFTFPGEKTTYKKCKLVQSLEKQMDITKTGEEIEKNIAIIIFEGFNLIESMKKYACCLDGEGRPKIMNREARIKEQ
jgi:hypothetical protein